MFIFGCCCFVFVFYVKSMGRMGLTVLASSPPYICFEGCGGVGRECKSGQGPFKKLNETNSNPTGTVLKAKAALQKFMKDGMELTSSPERVQQITINV